MSRRISVVAPVERGGAWLAALVRSLDRQSLDVNAFEIDFVVSDAALPVAARLTELSTRRPNVRVLTHSRSDDPAEWTSGEWILDLGSDLAGRAPVLFPQALERLVDFGDKSGCAVVLGRVVAGETTPVNDLFSVDREVVPGGVAADVTQAALVLRRRDQPADQTDGEPSVGVLSSYTCARVKRLPVVAPTGSTELAEVSYEWHDGRIVITAAGAVRGVPADAATRFSVFNAAGQEFAVAGRGELSADGSFTATAELDVRTAALGEPLARGLWRLRLGVHGDARTWTSAASLPVAPLRPGIVDGVLVAIGASGPAMTLDIGATRWSLVGAVSPSAVSISESAHGSLMTMNLDIAASGRSRTRGAVWLGDFDIPAHLVADGTRAYVECYVSGLPGSSPLATRFGGAKPTPARLSMTASPTGVFTVAESSATDELAGGKPARSGSTAASSLPLRSAGQPGSPTSAPAPHGAGQQPRRATSAATRLRRRVPERLEPLARAASRSKVARRVYRKLAGLSDRTS